MQKEFLLLESELVNCLENYLPEFKFRVPSINDDELHLLVQQCSEKEFTSSIKRSGNGVTIICEQINKVTILESDFENVDYTDPRDCALARAFKRNFPETKISVNADRIRLGLHNLAYNREVCDKVYYMCATDSINHIKPTDLVVVYKKK